MLICMGPHWPGGWFIWCVVDVLECYLPWFCKNVARVNLNSITCFAVIELSLWFEKEFEKEVAFATLLGVIVYQDL